MLNFVHEGERCSRQALPQFRTFCQLRWQMKPPGVGGCSKKWSTDLLKTLSTWCACLAWNKYAEKNGFIWIGLLYSIIKDLIKEFEA